MWGGGGGGGGRGGGGGVGGKGTCGGGGGKCHPRKKIREHGRGWSRGCESEEQRICHKQFAKEVVSGPGNSHRQKYAGARAENNLT